MTAVTLKQLSQQLAGFYVPQFELKIEGSGLPDDVLRDVVEVTYTDNIDELDSFEIVVNNWNERSGQFKYIGAETQAILDEGGDRARPYQLFEPCNKTVHLSMGYAGRLTLMMTATFTTMEPDFPANGPPILKVRGLNVLHQLRRKKYNDAYTNRKYSDIAEEVGRREDRELRARRFPLRVVTNDSAKASEEPIEFTAQKMEYDIDFLWKLAREMGYEVTILEPDIDENGRETTPRRLYFGPSETAEARVIYELRRNQSLIDFQPRLTTANQFRSVTVNGWNRRRQQAISVTVDFDDPDLNRLNPDLHEMVRKCDPREEHVVDRPVTSEREAKRIARDLLRTQNKQMVKASGSTVGLPGLRAGTICCIHGYGSRLSGKYYVTQSEHIVNDQGYITRFQARREQDDEQLCAPS